MAEKALELIRELEEEEDADDGFEEYKAKKKDAEKLLTQGTASQALQSSMIALEAMMAVAKLKFDLILSRIREILWLTKDAVALCKEEGDQLGRAVALITLTRVHLIRAGEPDAPQAAMKSSQEAVTLAKEVQDRSLEAEALCLVGESHIAKAIASPFEDVVLEQVNKAVAATKEAEEIYRQLDDKKGLGNALHLSARALLRHTDEDEVLEGERFADDARDIFRDIGDRASEVAVLMTGITARHATSGPESALMMARDAAEDWQQDGGRHKDVAHAQILAAAFQLELGEHDDALKLCTESQELDDRVGNKRGVAMALETRASILLAMMKIDATLKALEEMAAVYNRIDDKKAQARAFMLAANMLLHQLSEDVEKDTKAEFEKKEPEVGISTEDVHKRSAQGLEYANRASQIYTETGDEEGSKAVQELIQSAYNKAIEIYCQTNEPDQLYYTLDKDVPIDINHKPTVIKEWKIPVPAFQKIEGPEKGDGFLHVFDPHPPKV